MDEARQELAFRPLVLAALSVCIGLTAVEHPFNLAFLIPLLWAKRPIPVALAFAFGLILAPKPVPIMRVSCWVDAPAAILRVPQDAKEGISTDIEINGHRYRMVVPRETTISRGETWLVRGNAKPLSEAAEGLRYQGIEGKIKPATIQKLADGPLPWRIADGWRRSYASFAHKNLREEDARWLLGFAVRSVDFEDEEHEALVSTGTVHLIAASGLHVAILGLVAMGLVRAANVPRAWSLAIVAVLIGFYAMATGLHMPTVRASLAFLVGSAAYLFRREPDGLSALALAVLVFLPFDPSAIYSIGFQLSTVVVGMLVLWPKRLPDEPTRTAKAWLTHHLRDLAGVSLVAGLAAEPILAAREGWVSLLTVPANIIAVPPAMAAVASALILHPLHAAWAMPAVGGLVSAARWAIESAHKLPIGAIPVPPFSPYILVPLYGAWIWFWRPRARAI